MNGDPQFEAESLQVLSALEIQIFVFIIKNSLCSLLKARKWQFLGDLHLFLENHTIDLTSPQAVLSDICIPN